MGTVADKIEYTYKSIEDIKDALEEKGINARAIPLKEYGDIIRRFDSEISNSSIELKFYTKFAPIKEVQVCYTPVPISKNIEISDISAHSISIDYRDINAIVKMEVEE